ncbi:hypothetical protein [Streptomyces caatingaensis]|uniref:hypothetical protein n=1 Tax=Streptomyces caatingaensis TaxID=1678637 RepID=UPI0006727A6B|nr:hypothetical protein [Streptomyces caatingaensis]
MNALADARPGAVLLVPWRTRYSDQRITVRLTVSEDGRRAEGRFVGPAGPANGPCAPPPPPQDLSAEGDVSTTTLTEAEFLRPEAAFVLGLRLRACRQYTSEKARYGTRPVWLRALDDDPSWACVLFREDETLTTLVWQGGPRRLWDEAEAAYVWWLGRGSPGPERFGLTVDGEGSRVWLDGPGGVISCGSAPGSCGRQE